MYSSKKSENGPKKWSNFLTITSYDRGEKGHKNVKHNDFPISTIPVKFTFTWGSNNSTSELNISACLHIFGISFLLASIKFQTGNGSGYWCEYLSDFSLTYWLFFNLHPKWHFEVIFSLLVLTLTYSFRRWENLKKLIRLLKRIWRP